MDLIGFLLTTMYVLTSLSDSSIFFNVKFFVHCHCDIPLICSCENYVLIIKIVLLHFAYGLDYHQLHFLQICSLGTYGIDGWQYCGLRSDC